MMMAGAALFLGAYNLSKNTLFYYLISIMLGITTSIIILVYFISKFLLKVNSFCTSFIYTCGLLRRIFKN